MIVVADYLVAAFVYYFTYPKFSFFGVFDDRIFFVQLFLVGLLFRKIGLDIYKSRGGWSVDATLWGYLSIFINVLLTLLIFYTAACMISRFIEKRRKIITPTIA